MMPLPIANRIAAAYIDGVSARSNSAKLANMNRLPLSTNGFSAIRGDSQPMTGPWITIIARLRIEK